MKQNAFLAIVAAALILAGCANPALSNTDLANKQALAANLASGNALSVSSVTASLSNATTQTITITFNAPVVLSGTTVPGLALYSVSNAASATASWVRGTALTYSAVQKSTVAGGSSDVTLLVDLTSATSKVELVLSAATLASVNGNLKLDTNGNNTTGESTDDYVNYLAVSGPAPLTTGVNETPQATVQITSTGGTFLAGAGGSTLTFTVTDSAGGNNVDPANVFASSNTVLQQFDYAKRAWTDVSYTVSGTAPSITLTAGAVSVAGATYRVLIKDRTSIVETAATNGYTHSASYDTAAAPKLAVLTAPTTIGAASFADATPRTYQVFGTSSVTSVFNPSNLVGNKAGYVEIVFTGLGAAGLEASSVTIDHVKLLLNSKSGTANANTAVAVQWVSSEVRTTTTLNDTLRLYLTPGYAYQNVGARVWVYGLTTSTLFAANLANLTDLSSLLTITGNL